MSQTDPRDQAERFDRVYHENEQTYGAEPSQELIRFVDQCVRGGGRAEVRLQMPAQSIAQRAYFRARQLLLRHFAELQ